MVSLSRSPSIPPYLHATMEPLQPRSPQTEMVRVPVRVIDAQAKADSPCLRVTWVPRHDQVLLSLMLEQVRKGARNGTGFTKDAWKYMLVRFNRKLNLQYVVIQLKNRFKYYRGQYNIVKPLLEHGGFKWDSLTRMLRAEDEVWEKHIEKHPTFSKYRNRELPYDEFQKIFGSMTFDDNQLATSTQLVEIGDGVMIDGLNGKKNVGADEASMEFPPSLDDLVGTPNSEQSEGSLPSGENVGVMEQHIKHRSPSYSSSRRGSKRRLGNAEELHDALLKIAEASKLRASVRIESMREKWPVDKCIKELKAIEGLEDDLFVKALFIFRDEYNRSVFLSIDGDRRITWLRAACRDVSL